MHMDSGVKPAMVALGNEVMVTTWLVVLPVQVFGNICTGQASGIQLGLVKGEMVGVKKGMQKYIPVVSHRPKQLPRNNCNSNFYGLQLENSVLICHVR